MVRSEMKEQTASLSPVAGRRLSILLANDEVLARMVATSIGTGEDARSLETSEMGVLGGGARLELRAGEAPARLILVAGRPLREPVARHGPFVMNTRQELMQAFVDFQEGRF